MEIYSNKTKSYYKSLNTVDRYSTNIALNAYLLSKNLPLHRGSLIQRSSFGTYYLFAQVIATLIFEWVTMPSVYYFGLLDF